MKNYSDLIVYFLVLVTYIVLLNKWLWVIQKEHYIPFSIYKVRYRWLRTSLINQILLIATIILVEINILMNLDLYVAIILCFLILIFPYKSNSWYKNLVLTARVKRLIIVNIILNIGIYFIFRLFLSCTESVITQLFFVPSIIDIAALILFPIEKRLQKKFIDSAKTKLNSVNPKIVAITGSYGKTSTKVYVRDLISNNKNVCASAASFNNMMGLSRAVNETLMPNSEIFVAEMGTYGKGEIRKICEWVKPEVAVITAIGPMHLERMKTLENILEAKKEIMEDAKVVVINISDEMLKTIPNESKKFITVSTKGEDADVMLKEISKDSIEITYKGQKIESMVKPTVHLSNLGCAIAVALYFEVPFETIVSRIEGLVDPAHRRSIEVSPKGVVIIDDTFNLNPKGALEDIKLLKETEGNKKILVTPGMVELGSEQFNENKKFIEDAIKYVDILILVGNTNKKAFNAALEKTNDVDVKYFDIREDAVNWIRENASKNDVVLYANDLPKYYP